MEQLGVVSEEDAAKITKLTLCLDTHFLCYGVYGKNGGRNDPAVELVKLCKGNVDVAIELSELHRDYIVAMLDVNTVARGSNANVVSWGGHAEAYAKMGHGAATLHLAVRSWSAGSPLPAAL